jgi:hypothetical protein
VAHGAQAAPPAPHVARLCEEYGTQVSPLQQPPAHVAVLHAALWHWPPLQPPAPHGVST